MYEKFVTFHIGNKRIRFFQTANVFLNSTPPTFITLTCVLSHKTPPFPQTRICVIGKIVLFLR